MHKHKVLVVDDEELVRKAVRRTLSMMDDIKVLCASNASEGMELIAVNSDIEVVISDHKMPGKMGVDFISDVKREYPDIVTIVLTGYAELDTALKAINEGKVFKFLTKPWDKSEFMEMIKEAIEVHHTLKEARKMVATRKEEARRMLEELESEYPGITQVKRDEMGRIILEVDE